MGEEAWGISGQFLCFSIHKRDAKVLPGTVKTVTFSHSCFIILFLDEMGHIYILLDEMELDEMVIPERIS